MIAIVVIVILIGALGVGAFILWPRATVATTVTYATSSEMYTLDWIMPTL